MTSSAPTTRIVSAALSRDVQGLDDTIRHHLRPGGRVLDVGSGAGVRLADVRSRANNGARIGTTVGLDVAGALAASTGRWPGVAGVRGDGIALPFADQSFDVVVVGGDLLAHVVDPARVVREAGRVCVPGGTLVLALTQRMRIRGLKLGEAERRAELNGHVIGGRDRLLVALRVPGPRRGAMPVRVERLEAISPGWVERLLADLPVARGYEVVVKPLRWRTRPHVQAFCDFSERRITIQVPEPFLAFEEDIPYRAKRIGGGRRPRFKWFWRRVRFERPDELVRYLYLHEYYHWYLREVLGRRSGAETACDRFALQRFALR